MNIKLKATAKMIWFVTAVLVFALLYYAGYYYATNLIRNDNMVTKESVREIIPTYTDTNTVNNVSNPLVKANTKYIEESFNIDTDEFDSVQKKLPIEIIGCSRMEVIGYIEECSKKNTDKTVKNIQLVSFSENEIVVRKTVCNVESLYSYFVKSENNIVKIYNNDKHTLIIDTGIDISNLQKNYKEEIENGFFVETIHEVYNFLENITS